MARTRRYATSAQRKAAYRPTVPHHFNSALALTTLNALSTMNSQGRWREAVDLAAQLLLNVALEMQDYCDNKSETWHSNGGAEIFHMNLDQVTELQALLDDLRSEL